MAHKARYLYSELSGLIHARRECQKTGNQYADSHEEMILNLVENHMPSGSGIDSGTKIDLERSHADKLVFYTSYHHMNEAGYYDGWTEHTIVVTPSLRGGFHLRIGGRNRNGIKDYLYEVFDVALRADIAYWVFLERFPQFKVEQKWENEDGSASQCYQAWYVGTERFWNAPDKAYALAADLMEGAFYAK